MVCGAEGGVRDGRGWCVTAACIRGRVLCRWVVRCSTRSSSSVPCVVSSEGGGSVVADMYDTVDEVYNNMV